MEWSIALSEFQKNKDFSHFGGETGQIYLELQVRYVFYFILMFRWSLQHYLCFDYYLCIFFQESLGIAFKEFFKRHLVKENGDYKSFVLGNLLAGGFSGCATFCFIYPLDFTRTRLAIDMGRGKHCLSCYSLGAIIIIVLLLVLCYNIVTFGYFRPFFSRIQGIDGLHVEDPTSWWILWPLSRLPPLPSIHFSVQRSLLWALWHLQTNGCRTRSHYQGWAQFWTRFCYRSGNLFLNDRLVKVHLFFKRCLLSNYKQTTFLIIDNFKMFFLITKVVIFF